MHFDDFVEAIRTSPDDDAPRLNCADWLSDQGDEDRAEFIRLQCQAASANGATADVRRRLRTLLVQNRDAWCLPVKDLAIEVGFERGFIEYVTYATGSVERETPEIVAVAHTEAVEHLRDASQLLDLSALVNALPQLGHLRSLEIWNLTVTDQIEGLFTTPYLRSLERLIVQFERGRKPSPELLIRGLTSPHWANLKELCINIEDWPDDNRLPNDVISAIISEGHFSLKRLDLQGTWLDQETARKLVSSEPTRNLALLDLGRAFLTEPVLEILFDGFSAGSLQWLRLAYAEIVGQDGAPQGPLAGHDEWRRALESRFGPEVVDWESEFVSPWSQPNNPVARFWPLWENEQVTVTDTGMAVCRLV